MNRFVFTRKRRTHFHFARYPCPIYVLFFSFHTRGLLKLKKPVLFTPAQLPKGVYLLIEDILRACHRPQSTRLTSHFSSRRGIPRNPFARFSSRDTLSPRAGNYLPKLSIDRFRGEFSRGLTSGLPGVNAPSETVRVRSPLSPGVMRHSRARSPRTLLCRT